MFGYITANPEELSEAQRSRYAGVYCGICREIGTRSSQLSRLGLRYDMAFLALLLMSLYEPREEQTAFRCPVHPMKKSGLPGGFLPVWSPITSESVKPIPDSAA